MRTSRWLDNNNSYYCIFRQNKNNAFQIVRVVHESLVQELKKDLKQMSSWNWWSKTESRLFTIRRRKLLTNIFVITRNNFSFSPTLFHSFVPSLFALISSVLVLSLFAFFLERSNHLRCSLPTFPRSQGVLSGWSGLRKTRDRCLEELWEKLTLAAAQLDSSLLSLA